MLNKGCIKSLLPIIKLAVVFFVIIHLFSLIDFIPTWKPYRTIVIPTALILLTGVIGHLIFKNFASCKLIGSIIFIVSIIISFLLQFQTSESFISSRELIETMRDSNSNDVIFVYEYSEIPDGFIKNIITVQNSWIPVEKNILEVKSSFSSISNKNGKLILSFKSDDSLQYIYSDGEFKQIIKHVK